MSYRIFIDKLELTGSKVNISGEEARYILKVVRLEVGDGISICTDGGLEYASTIREIRKKEITVELGKGKHFDRESNLEITLCQAVPKLKKMDYIIQKSTELGVKKIIPYVSERSISRPEANKPIGKIARWNKIALEAARQSGRNIIPMVEDLLTWDELIHRFVDENDAKTLKVIAWESEKELSLKHISSNGYERAIVIIGPEGGLSNSEIAVAREKNFIPISLGKRILRTETAGIAAITLLQFLWGDMN